MALLLATTSCNRPAPALSSSVKVKLPPARELAPAPGFSSAMHMPSGQTRS